MKVHIITCTNVLVWLLAVCDQQIELFVHNKLFFFTCLVDFTVHRFYTLSCLHVYPLDQSTHAIRITVLPVYVFYLLTYFTSQPVLRAYKKNGLPVSLV